MSHELNEEARPAACSCGGFQAVGSPDFVLRRFIVHLQDALQRSALPVCEWKPGHFVNVHGRVTQVASHSDGRVRVTIDPEGGNTEECDWCSRAIQRGGHLRGCPHDSLAWSLR